MKEAIVLKGVGGTGKTTSIRKAYELLTKKHPNTLQVNPNLTIDYKDLRVVIVIDGVKIGIESQGDPSSRQKKSLLHFKNIGCDIIICACRSYGQTVENVMELNNIYSLTFIDKKRSSNKEQIASEILDAAQKIINQVDNFIQHHCSSH